MNRVLVTGGGGYIGTVLVPMLLADGARVRVIDRFFFGADLLAPHEHLELVREDVRRIDASHLAGVDAVIDLAAISNDPAGEEFQLATWQVNHQARVRVARMAREAGVERYLLASTCSVYGFQPEGTRCREDHPPNPLTTYARANRKAEEEILPLADERFTVVVLRQATAFGLSPRMRFDLAVNGMTWGAWHTGRLPVLRDGGQYRPMVHVADTARAQMFMLHADSTRVNGLVFNVGSNRNNYRIGDLARAIASSLPGNVTLEWYGEPDHRSYQVDFSRIEQLGFVPEVEAGEGAHEIFQALERGVVERSEQSITLAWYRRLTNDEELGAKVRLHGGILDIDSG